MTVEHREVTVASPAKRIDAWLAEIWPDLSRSRIHHLLKEGHITVNGGGAKPSQALAIGDQVIALLPDPVEISVQAEDIPLEILYEDRDILFLNKPRGMVVHPAAGNPQGTLVNALLYHCKDALSGINGALRPGIVHRLDKDTSGVLVVAKNDRAHRNLTEHWQETGRFYQALVHGNMPEPGGEVEISIGRHPKDRKKMAVTPGKGRRAFTKYQVLEHFPQYALIEAQIITGRTHQIRVSMQHLGHPVVGDPLYGPKKAVTPVMLLHCAKVACNHPITGQPMIIEAPLPSDFQQYLDKLRQTGRL